MHIMYSTKCENCDHKEVCKFIEDMQVIKKHSDMTKLSIEKELNHSPRATVTIECDNFSEKVSIRCGLNSTTIL